MLANVKTETAYFDRTFFWLSAVLIGFGLVMVYSSSIAEAESLKQSGGDTYYFLFRHLLALGIGIFLAAAATQFPLRFWQPIAPYFFGFALVLLVLVLIPGIGYEANFSRRWFRFLGFSFQPSELMKVAVVLYAADYTVRKASDMSKIRKGFLPLFAVMSVTGALLLLEPDFGAFVVITFIALGVLFLGGMNWRLFVVLLIMLVIGFVNLIYSYDYRMHRVLGFLNPWEDPFGRGGYQLTHALMAFGRGGLFGVGLGGSVEKLFYLPEAHTDFILAVVGEELGFLGVAITITAFAWLVFKMVAIGNQAARLERYFPALVAQGAAIWLGAQAFINMGVNVGMLPTKGLTLPLLSFGGSGLMMNCLVLGIVARIDIENRQLLRGVNF
ncbi:MAG: putative lipid II flippase FtsW [Burkholderiales bacterium]